MNSFLTSEELKEMRFKHLGKEVYISRNAQFYGAEEMNIGNHVRIDDFCILSGKIAIGNFIHIAAYSALYAGKERITLDDYANISSKVSIYAKTDDYSGSFMTNPMVPSEYTNIIEKEVLIKKHVIVGASSVILPGVILGEGAAVGACSLVNSALEPWTINVGIPAKFLKRRKKNILEYEKELVGMKMA